MPGASIETSTIVEIIRGYYPALIIQCKVSSTIVEIIRGYYPSRAQPGLGKSTIVEIIRGYYPSITRNSRIKSTIVEIIRGYYPLALYDLTNIKMSVIIFLDVLHIIKDNNPLFNNIITR